MLCAWVVARADEGLGYVEGIAKVRNNPLNTTRFGFIKVNQIGGMLLLNLSSPNQAFMVLRNLLEKSCLRAFYGGHEARDDVSSVAKFRNSHVMIYSRVRLRRTIGMSISPSTDSILMYNQ